MQNKKKLIFLLPNFSVGGAGNSILNICKNLNKKHYNFFIISLGKNYYKKDFLKLKAKIYELKYSKLIFSSLKIFLILRKLSKIPYKTILISNINYANVLSCILFKFFINLRLILIERTPIQELQYFKSNRDMIKKKIIYYLIKLFYRYADYRIGNSKNVSKNLYNLCGARVVTINPHIKIKDIHKKNNKIKNITWIGRFSPEKNINELILSLKFIENLKFNLKIVTNYKFNLTQYNLSKNLINKIKIIKFNKSKLNSIYNKTDILVSTSLYEGFPNVVAEAINYNCLIIASKSAGGITELIRNNSYGLFYTLGNPKHLAIQIKSAINNYNNHKKKIVNAKKNIINLALNSKDKYNALFKNI